MLQLSVFIENKPGGLKKLTSCLRQGGISLRAITIAETPDFGVARLIVDDVQKATEVLHRNDMVCSQTEVIAVEIKDTPGGLDGVLQVLENANLSLDYLYSFLEQHLNKALMVFRFKDEENEKATAVLTGAGFEIFKGKL